MVIDLIYVIVILIGPFFLIYSLYLLKDIKLKDFLVILAILTLIVFIPKNNKELDACEEIGNKKLNSLKESKNHDIVCLKKENKIVVLYGESHAKLKSSWIEGKKTIEKFDKIAIETSNLDGVPYWISYIAWKERAILDFIAYNILRLKESSRKTAKDMKKVIDLESTPNIREFDKEYKKNKNLFKNYVITKRNLRIKYNIIKNLKDEPMLVIIGKNHIKGLVSLLESEGFNK